MLTTIHSLHRCRTCKLTRCLIVFRVSLTLNKLLAELLSLSTKLFKFPSTRVTVSSEREDGKKFFTKFATTTEFSPTSTKLSPTLSNKPSFANSREFAARSRLTSPLSRRKLPLSLTQSSTSVRSPLSTSLSFNLVSTPSRTLPLKCSLKRILTSRTTLSRTNSRSKFTRRTISKLP